MKVPQTLENLVGKWRGVNRLHTIWVPDNPLRETESAASIELTARGRFLKIEYDWSFENAPQEGLILVGTENEEFKAFWIDSWHMGNKFMVSEGSSDGTTVSLKGFYSVPDHPDWSWRTIIETKGENSFSITMTNVSPEGEETPAVEMNFQRK